MVGARVIAQRGHQLVPVLGADGSALVLQLGPGGGQQIRHQFLQPSTPAEPGVFFLVGPPVEGGKLAAQRWPSRWSAADRGVAEHADARRPSPPRHIPIGTNGEELPPRAGGEHSCLYGLVAETGSEAPAVAVVPEHPFAAPVSGPRLDGLEGGGFDPNGHGVLAE